MTPQPAIAEPAATAGTGPEGHRRSSSAESGIATENTVVAVDVPNVDKGLKAVAIEATTASSPPPHCVLKRAASNADLAAHAAKRGRIPTETASGAPALAATTTTAGSPTAAAPNNVSIYTATAHAVAGPNANAIQEPNEASDVGDHDGATVHGAAACATGTAGPDSAEPKPVVAPGSAAPSSRAIAGVTRARRRGLAPAPAPATTAAATHHASALGGGTKSAVIIANPTSRGRASCPPTPVVSRLPVLPSYMRASTAPPTVPVSAAPTPAPALAVPPASATVRRHMPFLPKRLPQHPPDKIAALCRATANVSRGEPDADPAVEAAIQRWMDAVVAALCAIYTGAAEPTNGHRSTSPPPPVSENPPPGNPELDASLDDLERYADRPPREDGWDHDDPTFDYRLYVEDPAPTPRYFG